MNRLEVIARKLQSKDGPEKWEEISASTHDYWMALAATAYNIIHPLLMKPASEPAPPSEIAPLFVAYRLNPLKGAADALSSYILGGLVESLQRRPVPEDPSDWRIGKYLVRNGEVQSQVLAEDEYSEQAFTLRWKVFPT